MMTDERSGPDRKEEVPGIPTILRVRKERQPMQPTHCSQLIVWLCAATMMELGDGKLDVRRIRTATQHANNVVEHRRGMSVSVEYDHINRARDQHEADHGTQHPAMSV